MSGPPHYVMPAEASSLYSFTVSSPALSAGAHLRVCVRRVLALGKRSVIAALIELQ
jgi:hypothetical protein